MLEVFSYINILYQPFQETKSLTISLSQFFELDLITSSFASARGSNDCAVR